MPGSEHPHSHLVPDQELDFTTRFEHLHRDIFGNLDQLVDQAVDLAQARGSQELPRGEEYNEQLWEQIKYSFRTAVEALGHKKGALDLEIFLHLYMNLEKNAQKVQRTFGVDLDLQIPYHHLDESDHGPTEKL